MATDTPCFLELEEWKAIDMFPNHDPIPAEVLIKEFYNTATCLPRLRQEAKIYQTGKKGHLPLHELILSLQNLQIFFDNCVETLRLITETPKQVLSSRGDELFPFVYKFESNSIAALYCHCTCFSILARRSLAELGVSGWDSPLIRNILIENICRSEEFATSKESGVFGLFYISFALRIAYGIARGPKQSWIENKLAEIAQIMPVARANHEDIWPDIEEVFDIAEIEYETTDIY